MTFPVKGFYERQSSPCFASRRKVNAVTMRRLAGIVTGLLVCGALSTGMAQNRNSGEIKGTVEDATGGVVPGVTVQATNTDTGQVTGGKTNDDGIYDLPFVPAGPYKVVFTKEGYETVTENNVTLFVEPIALNVKLKVGQTTTKVEVNAASSALLGTESAEINLTLTPELLTQLPNIGGDWKYMTELLPGVAPGRYQNGTGGGLGSTYYVSINGSQADQYNLLLDGGVSSSFRSGDPGNTEPPLDAMAELNVSTALFGADSGNGTSTFNVITKGGTNQFHGSVWERVQNTALQAKPFGPNVPAPAYRWNQYGLTIGGPVLRDRLFFFFSYQRNPITNGAPGFYTVPEDAVRGLGSSGDSYFDPSIYGVIYDPATETVVNGIKTRQPFPNNTIPAARVSPVAAAMLQYFPRSNTAFTNGSNYFFTGSAPVLNQYYSYRGDFDITKKNRISGSSNYTSNSYINPYPANPAGYFNYRQLSNNTTGQLTDAWTISPTIVNEARFAAFNQTSSWSTPDTKVDSKLGIQNTPFDVFPHVFISGGVRNPYNLNGDLFAVINNLLYSAGDSLTWSLGKHSLKIGGEWNTGTDEFAWNQINAGNFSFSGVATTNPNLDVTSGANNATGGSGLADFLLGEVANYNNNVPIIPHLTIWNLQAYVQDSYKVRPNLTVNAGLRFLYQSGVSESQGRFSNFEPTLINPATQTPGAVAFGTTGLGHSMEKNKPFVQPRLGVSWELRPSYVFRAGVGLYNIPWTANNYAQNEGNGYSRFVNVNPPTNSYEPTSVPFNAVPSLVTPQLTADALNGSGVNYQPYDTPIVSLWEYQVGLQHLFGGYLVDIAYVGTKGNNLAFTGDHTQIPVGQLGAQTHPFSQFSNVNYLLQNGTSNYNALQLQTKKQFHNGFIYQVTYTYAKTLDTGTGQGGIGAGSVDTYQNAYDPMANYGPANSDLRHVFNGSAIYQLPFGKNKPFLNKGAWLDAAVGGWQISTAFQSHTGAPFTPYVGGTDNSGRYSGGIWFANSIGSGKLSHRTQAKWFNYDDFTVPSPDTLGNERRNSVSGPNFNQIDLSAGKTFQIPKLREGTTFQFKADAYNVLNHPNLGFPNAAIYSSDAQNASSGSGSIAGAVGAVNGNGMRNLQLEGHIRF